MQDKPILRRLMVPAAFLALALTFGACGDGDEEGAASAGGSGGTAMGSDSGDTEKKEASGSGGEAAERTDKVAIVDFQFKPATVEVPVGSTVTWTNDDGFPHTATANDKSFDTGNLDKGQTGTAKFEKAGTFEYFCAIHNSMTGTVVVK